MPERVGNDKSSEDEQIDLGFADTIPMDINNAQNSTLIHDFYYIREQPNLTPLRRGDQ